MVYTGRSILIGTPLPPDYKIDARLSDIIHGWDKNDERVEIYQPNSDSPEEGRDKIVYYAKYRIPSPTHVLFIDADVTVRHATLKQLMSHDKDIIMGVYPMVQNGKITWSVSREDKFTPIEREELPRNPFKIKSGGFGIVLVKYEVFETLEWPYWKREYVPGGTKLGEDIYFCNKARDAGYSIWCDPTVKCVHCRTANLLQILNSIRKETKNGSI